MKASCIDSAVHECGGPSIQSSVPIWNNKSLIIRIDLCNVPQYEEQIICREVTRDAFVIWYRRDIGANAFTTLITFRGNAAGMKRRIMGARIHLENGNWGSDTSPKRVDTDKTTSSRIK